MWLSKVSMDVTALSFMILTFVILHIRRVLVVMIAFVGTIRCIVDIRIFWCHVQLVLRHEHCIFGITVMIATIRTYIIAVRFVALV